MKEQDKLGLYDRSKGNGNTDSAWEGRLVKVPDFYEILDPQEAPDFRGYARILRKRLPTVLIVFFILFSIALIATLKQKPVYRAQVLLEIRKENPDIPTIQELYELDSVSDAYLRSQYTILSSESLARRVIDQLGLDALSAFHSPQWWPWRQEKRAPAPQVFGTGPSRADREVCQRVLERFEDRLRINPISRSRLLTIQFDSHDAELSARVVNSLAENYVEQNLEARWAATQKAADWLSQQLLGVKAKLEGSEEQLQNYARRNDLIFLETDKGPSRNVENELVQQLQEELTKAEAQRFEKEALYRVVEAGDYESLPGISENKVIQDLTERLAELKREVDTNKQLYEGLLQRLKEASVSASLKASNIRIVDSAEPPAKPVKPRIPLFHN